MSSFENAQYTDPLLIDLYDLQNAGVDDYRFYEQLIGDEAMVIADIGCGTGVFAMRLANLGHIVTAIEPAPEMLKVARTRHGNGKIQWLQGVAKHLPADIRLDVAVMTGHAFQCLLTDEAVQETLKAIHGRLHPGGRMMFESRNPECKPWQRWAPEHSRKIIQLNDDQVEIYHETQDMDGELLSFITHFNFLKSGMQRKSQSVLRFMSHERIAEHLHQAGFGHVDWFGNWKGQVLMPASDEIIAIAQA